MSAVVVDDSGIRLPGDAVEPTTPLDVRFGAHRVWSFTTGHDGHDDGSGTLVGWPAALAAELDGVARVTIVPHNGGDALFEGEVRFGTSTEALELVDDAGNPLSLDKGNRLQRTFDRMDDGARAELAAASKRVLDDLVTHCGRDAYLAYGCLLGAVRDGHMIGHDSDADLGFLSKHTHPFDIIRESRAAEHEMRGRGWQVVRMSAANFKVWVPMPNGKRAGIDVFGSFHIGDHFHVTGSLRGELPRDAIVPFGTVVLEGVEFPAPRDVERFLAFTYGPRWRVPDPAFHFDHPPEHTAMMSQWFRASRANLWYWSEHYGSPAGRRVAAGGSDFAAWAAARMAPGSRVVEVGSGTGRDAFWLADQGFRVTGTDYAGAAVKVARAQAKQRREGGAPWVGFRAVNFESEHSWLTRGARYAHDPVTKHVYARELVDALSEHARQNLWRFSSMLGRSGGHTFVELGDPQGDYPRTAVDPDVVRTEIASHGGRVVDAEQAVGCRLELAWERPDHPDQGNGDR